MMFDLDTTWLKLSYFGLSHKDELRKWWVMILLAVDVFIVVFIFTNLIMYFVNLPKEQKVILAMASSEVNYRTVKVNNTPLPLEVISTAAINKGETKYDLVTLVRNSNEKWAIQEISYVFSIAGSETEVLTDFVMPNSEKYLTAQNVVGPADFNSRATFTIQDIVWRRVENPKSLVETNFLVENIEYAASTTEAGYTAYRVTADITNRSFNSFWQTKFVVVPYSGDQIVGVSYIYLDEFKSEEQRYIYTQWNNISRTITGVKIQLDIDLLDKDNIILG